MASPHRVRRARTLDNKGYTSQEDEVQIPPAASSTTATMAYFYDDGILSGDETETQRPSYVFSTFWIIEKVFDFRTVRTVHPYFQCPL